MAAPSPNFGSAVPPPRAGRNERYHIDPVGDCKVWSVSGDKYQGCPGAQPTLTPSFYSCGLDSYGRPVLTRFTTAIDDLIRLPDPVADMLLKEFVLFWERSDNMTKLGLTIKRGLLFWGPPGGGKSSVVQLMAAHMIREKDGVVVMAGPPEVTTACLHMLRLIEPDRPVITVYEDIDAMVDQHGEAALLSLLDGETQIDKVVNVACTNYPERLDKRFVDRPGRFDRVTYVGMPSQEARLAYLKAKAPELQELKLERWARKSEDWSLAHLRELIVATQVLGEDDNEVIERLRQQREELASSERAPDAPALGFQRG